jgi:hypothetical protein
LAVVDGALGLLLLNNSANFYEAAPHVNIDVNTFLTLRVEMWESVLWISTFPHAVFRLELERSVSAPSA